jgi:hypothetical protein
MTEFFLMILTIALIAACLAFFWAVRRLEHWYVRRFEQKDPKIHDGKDRPTKLKSLNVKTAPSLSHRAENTTSENEATTPPSAESNGRATSEPQLHPRPVANPHKSAPPETKKPTTIFISYRRQGSGDVTGRIYDRLVQHFGREAIFKDVDSIPFGVDFRKFLGDEVGRCNVFLAIIGRQWLNSENERGMRRLYDLRDFVRIEIETALARGIPVIPVIVQGAEIPSENDLPPSVQALVYRNAISIRPDPDFHHDVDRLIKGIELHFNK